MKPSIWLFGSLASHRRSRILQSALNAQPISAPPEIGICLLFGTDFQEGDEMVQQDWYTWTHKPGRVLLLIPPFKSGTCTIPSTWEVSRCSTPPPHSDSPVGALLASEVQYKLQGQLQSAELWEDQTFCTAYYRKHPHSGLFSITCLPMWSLSVLDQPEHLQHWFDQLYSLAGSPIEDVSQIQAEDFQLQPEHYTVLLHLVSRTFASESMALAALHSSAIFSINTDKAIACMQDIQKYGLAIGGQLTNLGREILLRSPYKVYIHSLEALKQ